MNCRYCGSVIDKNDDTCPNCGCVPFEDGKMLSKKEKLVNNASAHNNINSSNIPTLKTIKANPKLPIIPIILICLLVLGFGHMRRNNISVIPKLNNKEKIVKYAGYEMSVPTNFKVKEKDKELYINNKDKKYKLVIDFDHSYKDYYSYYSNSFPDLIKDCNMKIDSKEYCGITNSNKVMVFFTDLNSNKTIIGMVNKGTDSSYSKSDLNDINKILSTIKEKKKDITYDVGGEDFVSLNDIK